MDNLSVPNQGTLKFESVAYRRSMGKIYAFVTCIDILKSGNGTEEKKYWGEVKAMDDPEDIFEVMLRGEKWNYIP